MEISFDLEGNRVALRIRATDGEEESLLKSIEKGEGVVIRFSQAAILEVADEIRRTAARA